MRTTHQPIDTGSDSILPGMNEKTDLEKSESSRLEALTGIDISSALNDVNAALPRYRFSVRAQKASCALN